MTGKSWVLLILLLLGLFFLFMSPIEIAPFISTVILVIYMEVRLEKKKDRDA